MLRGVLSVETMSCVEGEGTSGRAHLAGHLDRHRPASGPGGRLSRWDNVVIEFEELRGVEAPESESPASRCQIQESWLPELESPTEPETP